MPSWRTAHREPRRRVHSRQPRGRSAAHRDHNRRVGAAQIAFMNPGGLRQDMPQPPAPYPRRTYQQAANVQPFANTLVNMDLTGTNQGSPGAAAAAAGASRPFLRLGMSRASRTPTTRPRRRARITSMWLAGRRSAWVDLLGHGELVPGRGRRQLRSPSPGAPTSATPAGPTGGMVDDMAEFDRDDTPLAVDYTQRSVGVQPPVPAAPARYQEGTTSRSAFLRCRSLTRRTSKDTSVVGQAR